MKKEDLISLLKSKQSIAELLNNNDNNNNNNNYYYYYYYYYYYNDNNNNLYEDGISDIRRILSRLRDVLPKTERKLKIRTSKKYFRRRKRKKG